MRRPAFILSMITIVSALLLGCVMIFWMVYPYKTIEFKDEKFYVSTKEVKQGDAIKFVARYCKYTHLPALVARSFMNDIFYAIPYVTTNRPTGCDDSVIAVKVPQELPAGTYYLKTRYIYQVNPIRTIVVEMNTDDFTVIGGE